MGQREMTSFTPRKDSWYLVGKTPRFPEDYSDAGSRSQVMYAAVDVKKNIGHAEAAAIIAKHAEGGKLKDLNPGAFKAVIADCRAALRVKLGLAP